MGVQYGAGPVIKCDAWDPTQIHRDLHGDGINKPHPFMMKLRMVDVWFTTLEIISLKSHRTPKMFGDMMMMMLIIIITENLFLAIFWAFHMSAGRSGVVFSN